jgi:hypothetical protein
MQIPWVFSGIYVFLGLTLSILLDWMIQGLFERSESHPEVITRFSGVSNKSPSKLNGKLVNFSTR